MKTATKSLSSIPYSFGIEYDRYIMVNVTDITVNKKKVKITISKYFKIH